MTDASRPKFSNPRWEQLLRYRYIELIALWEGRLTTRQLCETFGIGRQQANKDLTSYRRGLTRGDLVQKIEYIPAITLTKNHSWAHNDQ